MGRGALLQLPTDEDDDSSGRIIIPTIDGEVPITNHEGARVHLQDIEALQISRDDQLLRHHIHAVYRDDFLLNTKSGTQISQRPRSLAVPGITTSSALLQEPQGPVMSISPQATYLSTVIPNAILPSAIDVIEIDRSCNRRSVRTVSKSSLAPASPASSRSGGGTHDEPNSTSSKWSHSQSSETIVSHTSTISFKGSIPSSHVTDSMKEVTDLNEEQMSFKSLVSCSSSTSKAGSQRLEQGEISDGAETAQNSRLFSRNLSVMKAKLPPAPPRRTYSLHLENLKQRPRELGCKKDLKYLGSNGRQLDADLNMKEDSTLSYTENISTQSPLFDESKLSVTASPLRPVQDSIEAQSESINSSPQDIFERTLSPSSGYSSQSGTPTHSSKDICPTSPGKQKLKPPKPERTVTRISPAVSVSSSLVSLSSNLSDPANQLKQTHTTQSQPPKISPTTTTIKNKVTPLPTANLRELFNIPPPPKVKAPCPPPPETWAHNERTTELLCGPNPSARRIFGLQKHYQTDILLMKNQATADTTNLTSGQRQISVETEMNGTHSEDKAAMSEGKDEHMLVQEQVPLDEREQVSHVINKREHVNSEELKSEEESPVNSMKLQSADKVNQILLLKEQCVIKSCHVSIGGLPENDFSTPETERTDTEDQCFVKHTTDKEIPKHKLARNLSVEGPRVIGIFPSPSPPPEHSPPPPPSKTFSVCSVTVLLQEEEVQTEMEQGLLTLEHSWPPPPPPLDEPSDLVFEGQDEIDFPPPPPPGMQESFIVISEHYKVESSGQRDSVAPEKPPVLSDISSHTEQNQEPQIIQSTTLVEKTINESLPVDSIPNMSDDKLFDQTHDKPQSFENVSQVCIDLLGSETPVPSEISLKSSKSHDIPLQTLPQETLLSPQHDPLNPPATLPKDLSQCMSHAPAISTDLKITPPLPMEDQSTVNFKRQPSLISKDSRCKGLSSLQKCAPIPKEDANIPLVTPSLLQMVRLRTVNVEDQVNLLSQEDTAGTETTPDQDLSVSIQVTPQKPVRKSMQSPVKSSSASSGPSMRLQEAIRMKTAAMSSSGFPARPSLRLPTPTAISNDMSALSPKTPDDCKSPASTASFIFSKSTKKVVIETATSPEAQASLKQSLAAELMQISDQHKSMVTNGTKKHHKVPPPVAKKPVHVTSPSEKVGTVTKLTIVGSSSKQNNGVANNQQTD